MSDKSALIAPFDDAAIPSLQLVANPGMITVEEEKLYFDIARRTYRRDRLMLEIGTWLGLSTQRICSGMSAAEAAVASRRRRKASSVPAKESWTLHCMDMFHWSSAYRERALNRGVDDLVNSIPEGASFEPLFRALMGPYSDRIRTYVGRVENIDEVLQGQGWPNKKPLGALFLDSSKGWPGNAKLLRHLAPQFAHGVDGTEILFQDYLYFPAFKLIFLVQMLPELEVTSFVRSGTSINTRVASPLSPMHPILQDGAIRQLTEAQIRAAWGRIECTFPSEVLNTQGFSAALPLMLWECRYREAADEEFYNLKLDGQQIKFMRSKVAGNLAAFKIPVLREILGL